MGDNGISFGPNSNTLPGYPIDNGDFDTKETDGTDKKTENSSFSRNWENLLGGPSVTFGSQQKIFSFVLENPDLEPSVNITPQERNEAYDSILQKLKWAKGGMDGNRSVMFDIYAVMDIIQETSQDLRNALREMRKLENTTLYSNIRAQAEIQRESAVVGAVAGAVMCALQSFVVVSGMMVQLRGPSVSSKTVGKGAMTSSVKLENMMKDLKVRADGQKLDNPSLHTKLLDQHVVDIKGAKAEYLSAKNEYMRAKETAANGGPMPKGKLDGLRSKMETARGEYDSARQHQVEDMSKMVDCGTISREDLDAGLKGMSADVEELRGLSKAANSPVSGDGQQNAVKGIMVQQVGMAIGGFLQQLASSIREIISSKATELQAEQKLTEEQFDQVKDLFSLAQGVIQKSIDVFASVIQKESSVIEGIIQHV